MRTGYSGHDHGDLKTRHLPHVRLSMRVLDGGTVNPVTVQHGLPLSLLRHWKRESVVRRRKRKQQKVLPMTVIRTLVNVDRDADSPMLPGVHGGL